MVVTVGNPSGVLVAVGKTSMIWCWWVVTGVRNFNPTFSLPNPGEHLYMKISGLCFTVHVEFNKKGGRMFALN